MKICLMKPGQSRARYLRIARSFCRDRYNHHRQNDHRHCHYSFAVEAAMRDTAKKFPDLGTFGVVGDCAMNGEGHVDVQYLNTGDAYADTICFWQGSFIIASCGDLMDFVMK